MRAWILYKSTANAVKPEAYEIDRFEKVAAEACVDLKVLQPEQFDLTVTREDKRSILVDGKMVDLPDVIIPRMGAGTTYFGLAVIRHLERLGLACSPKVVPCDMRVYEPKSARRLE